ncbi:MAG: exo-alpha-sialidase [Chitinophagaceae bacterium]|nr:MAG: exo-alpha-sialidase [Chitinophagaceae bacterium]
MKKKLIYIILFMSLFEGVAFSQTIKVVWRKKVMVDDMPGNYGSQYGRMLHLKNDHWLAAYTVSVNAGYRKDPNGGLRLQISESDDGGLHWKKISRIIDKGRDLDNAELIQLPDGAVLLACRSVRWQESYRLPVYQSNDLGKTWKRIGIIDANEGKPGELGHPDKGVYEPHFCFLKDGRLAVMYANEKHVTDKDSYSQIVSEKISPNDGKTWGKEIWVAYQPGDHLARPGMSVWTKMSDNKYIAVYEVCGPEKCNIYEKISDDGIHWPVGLGEKIPDQTGAPFILSLPDGRLIVTSNCANISSSSDYGETWHQTNRPWNLKKSYESDWTQAIWSALYQTGTNSICIITSVKQKNEAHQVEIRFGRINPED